MLCLLLSATAFAQQGPGVSTPVVTLNDATPAFEITTDVLTWLEAGHTATVDSVHEHNELLTLKPALARQQTSGDNVLWMHFLVQRDLTSRQEWSLNIPLPFVDDVTLFVSDGNGGWSRQRAGDTLAQSQWTHPWLYPDFVLDIPPGATRAVYLRVENFSHLSMPILAATRTIRDSERLLETLAIGVTLGLLFALAVLSGFKYLEYRNRADAGAVAFGLLIALVVAQINGVLSALLWADVPAWGNYAYAILPVLGLGGALQFLRHLYGLSGRYRRYDRFLQVSAWLTIGSIGSFLVLPIREADQLCGLVLFLATLVAMLATVLNAYKGSTSARWMLVSFIPQCAAMLWLAADQFGAVETVWQMRYFMSFALALIAPLLTYSLHVATQGKNELMLRANLLPVQDALTGLLTREAFVELGRKAFTRVMERGEPVALVMIELVNYDHIRQTFDNQIAEQSLLRTVVKLHRVLRDVDQAGRVDTARFALLLDGVFTRDQLSERAVKLIASGLIPLPGLQPLLTLQFHAACLLLHEHPLEPGAALDELSALLAEIKPGTRRPIRFIEPVSTQAAGLAPEHSDL